MNFGLLPNLEMDQSICTSEITLRSAAEVTEEVHKWDQFVNYPDDQGQTGTCAARAESGRAEVLINSAFGGNTFGGKDYQLDAISVYIRAHEIRYPGRKISFNDGLNLIDPVQACIDLGIYPRDAEVKRIPIMPYDIFLALQSGPLTYGLNVHDGWRSINPQTGEIPNAPALAIRGHAVLGVGLNLSTLGSPALPLPTFVNSWSNTWGWNGMAQIEFSSFKSHSIDNPILVLIDPMWFKKSIRWRDFVVHAPSGVIPLPSA